MRMNRIGWGVVASVILVALAQTVSAMGPPKNGLSSEAFRRNALTTNSRALGILLERPLDNGLLSAPNTDADAEYIRLQLQDPLARAMAAEIIKCALNESTELSYLDSQTNTTHKWRGELGLCQSPGNDWSTARPTPACQQLVTACVAARVNALQMSIPLSLRGQPGPYPLEPRVPTDRTYRASPDDQDPAEGTPIHSFEPVCGPDRECNWAQAYVGRCMPGKRIKLAPQGNGVRQLRVCAGIHGCASSSADSRVAPSRSPESKWIEETPRVEASLANPSPAAPSLELDCPAELPGRGYYSVMIQRGQPSASILVEQLAGSGTYPAPEAQVFTFREGAFYGNLFDPDSLAMTCVVPDQGVRPDCSVKQGYEGLAEGVPYLNVHACYSLAQQREIADGDLSTAYINSRICDNPNANANCFHHKPRPCTGGSDSARCTWVSGAGVYRDCKSPGDPSKIFQPITTYLNEPCDLIKPGSLCDKVRALSSSSECTGCLCGCSRSCSAGGGALQLLPAVALLALLLRKRRRRRAG